MDVEEWLCEQFDIDALTFLLTEEVTSADRLEELKADIEQRRDRYKNTLDDQSDPPQELYQEYEATTYIFAALSLCMSTRRIAGEIGSERMEVNFDPEARINEVEQRLENELVDEMDEAGVDRTIVEQVFDAFGHDDIHVLSDEVDTGTPEFSLDEMNVDGIELWDDEDEDELLL